MGTAPFGVIARSESNSVEPGRSTLWAALEIDPIGRALEDRRAPLAVALVVDTSGSMAGDPLAHVVSGAKLLANLLGERDRLAIVTFADHASVRCGLTATDPAGRAQIDATLRDITAHGSTNLHGGIGLAAGVLLTAPADLRRVMVVMSDGQPNVGISSPDGLAAYVSSLAIATSTLGFGLHHDENVLDAIATAGSGRYAYIPDPILARVDLARAALAHGGIVADQLELAIRLSPGVELVQILPARKLRHGATGVRCSLGDIFIDEGRAIALELQLDLDARSKGRLVELFVTGRSPDGKTHEVSAAIDVDIRAGARTPDRDAAIAILLIQAEAARTEARHQADRGSHPTAVAILKRVAARIEQLAGFVRNDGSPIAELYEQLADEVDNYSRRSSAQEYAHQRKASTVYKAVGTATSPHTIARPRGIPAILAQLVGMNHGVAGKTFRLFDETVVGRSSGCDVFVGNGQLSRRHARIVFVGDHYVLSDAGSSNGTKVNGKSIHSAVLADGDEVLFGDVLMKFELVP